MIGDGEDLAAGPTRFWSKVIKGPRPGDCWVWVGAIGDDGYGRFWENVPDGQRMWRAHRFAVALILRDGDLSAHDKVRHELCDVPLCVHVTDGLDSHLLLGTTADNNRDRSQAGRHANMYSLRRSGGRRRDQAAHSRELRDHLLAYGWDDHFRLLLAGHSADQETLF